MARYKIDPYLLDEKEELVLKSIRINETPLKISKDTSLPRSTVYFILEKLKKRGFVKKIQKGKKVIWVLRSLESPENKDEDQNNQETRIYSSKEDLKDFLEKFVMADDIRFKSLNGDDLTKGWSENIRKEKIIEFNNHIKQNELISDLISSKKPLEEHVKAWGEEWISSFAQKPTEYHLLDSNYTSYKAQIFLKRNKLFLINMSRPIVIEIKDKEIVKMFESLFEFIKDNTKSINVSEFLKNI